MPLLPRKELYPSAILKHSISLTGKLAWSFSCDCDAHTGNSSLKSLSVNYLRNTIQLGHYVIITAQEIIDNFTCKNLFYGKRLSATFYLFKEKFK